MIYIVLAIIASMALNAPLGMAIGFVLALLVALAQSHGTMRDRIRQVLGMAYVRAITAFAIACLVYNELDDWKVVAIAWLIAAFSIGAWRTHGRLAGMVLVDARHEFVDDHRPPEQLAAEEAEQRQFQNMIRWTARLGLVRLLWAPALPSVLPGSENLTPETRTAIGVLQARPRQIETALAEEGAKMDSNTQLRTAASLGATPLIVLASAQNVDHDPIWKEAQQIMAGLSSNSRLVIAQSGHAVHYEQAAQVMESIRQVVEAARTGQPLKP